MKLATNYPQFPDVPTELAGSGKRINTMHCPSLTASEFSGFFNDRELKK